MSPEKRCVFSVDLPQNVTSLINNEALVFMGETWGDIVEALDYLIDALNDGYPAVKRADLEDL